MMLCGYCSSGSGNIKDSRTALKNPGGLFRSILLLKRAGIFTLPALTKINNVRRYFALANFPFAAAAFFTFSVARSAAPNGLSFAKSTNIGAATKIEE